MNNNILTSDKHKEQIEAYTKIIGSYRTYADVLRRVLQNACWSAFPEALIQTREKSLSSFAEKVARKFHKYKNPIQELTDLCGGRVIVQTLEQVEAVCCFVEANFEVLKKDDKGLLLGESMFGHRDMHYLVRLKPDRDEALAIMPEERAVIYGLKNRTAEIQVRTWLQHAWADTTHDRLYKSSLTFSTEIVREGNLLAAEMERGDRGFNRLVSEIDGMIANYSRVAPKAEVEKEIGVQQLILDNEPEPAKKPALALKLARLCASCGDDARVVRLLESYAGLHGANRCEALLLLGFSLCRMHAAAPSSRSYRTGLDYLSECVDSCEYNDVAHVEDLRKRKSLRARALTRLGWAWEQVPGKEHRARECYQNAYAHEPENPYYLAEMLGVELRCSSGRIESIESLRATIRVAVATCEEHARTSVELPCAYFTAGRLAHLLEESAAETGNGGGMADGYVALGWYARGIRYVLDGRYCVAPDALANEEAWLKRIFFGKQPPVRYQHLLELLSLARTVAAIQEHRVADGTEIHPYRSINATPTATAPITAPVLIVSGRADTFNAAAVEAIRPLLLEGLAAFSGTVISGGTTAGVPGCVGDVAGQLAADDRKRFRLLAYRPERLPDNAKPHPLYDEAIRIGGNVDSEQILRNWRDVLAAGIQPRDVLLLGFGGSRLSALEYQIAAALGASVGIVSGTGGEADALPADPVWAALPNLLPLANDPMTVRAFVAPKSTLFNSAVLEEMARAFHEQYVADNTKALPDKMRPWKDLKETFKKANLDEAACAARILEAANFALRPSEHPMVFDARSFTEEEVERMAEMEHGRWVVERLRDGWRLGPRNDAKKLHDCLLPWTQLPDGPDGVREYDRKAVRAFPQILAKAGLEVTRI